MRLYGAAFCLMGGGAYFLLFSPWVLRLGWLCADLAALFWRILTIPLRLALRLLKKCKELFISLFLFRRKWYRISQMTQEMETVDRRRRQREGSGWTHEAETDRFFDQAGDLGPAGVHGHLSAGSCGAGLESAQQQLTELTGQVETQRLKNQELADAVEHRDDPEMLEQMAREKGYVKQGETLYIDVAN